jgi:hypothetical protein
VKEVGRLNGDVSEFVALSVRIALEQRFKELEEQA